VPRRHQSDYTHDWLPNDSDRIQVGYTVALGGNSLLRAGDATAASLSGGELRSVCRTECSWGPIDERPERVNEFETPA
jgi:hypothetical protein